VGSFHICQQLPTRVPEPLCASGEGFMQHRNVGNLSFPLKTLNKDGSWWIKTQVLPPQSGTVLSSFFVIPQRVLGRNKFWLSTRN
jgi:hypothetical protein